MDEMHARTQMMIGAEGVEKLRDASVILCGCGAVGGYVLEGLVRAGVGHIRIVDCDVFSESNINRQILATHSTVGRPKVQVALERARDINPDVDIDIKETFVDGDSIPGILEGEHDILIDAIDTVGPKCMLLEAACASNIRTFSSMGAALHMDASMVRIAPLKKTSVCPLARLVRNRLKGCDTSTITAVYSEEPPMVRPGEADEHGKSVLGSMPTIPAIFGMTLANEAIRCILGMRD